LWLAKRWRVDVLLPPIASLKDRLMAMLRKYRPDFLSSSFVRVEMLETFPIPLVM
jgi:hypothetical protein